MNTQIPVLKEIVLLGGGHSHALVIRRWAMKPLAGVRLTLVSRDVLTPYSGMLPGYISGHYTSDDIHMDLSQLCRWAGVRFIEATITGLDLDAQQVFMQDRPALGYDVLSIDIGSTPDTSSVPGAAEFAIPVKPIFELQMRMEAFMQRLEDPNKHVEIAVVGSGVGGFELLLALDYKLKARQQAFHLHWILRFQSPIKTRPEKVQGMALDACQAKGITVHKGFDVQELTRDGLQATDGRFLDTHEIFWCTAAAAAPWPGEAGLQTDKKGFIATNAYLQSLSHNNVFASGDIATQIETPSEKAGVFAVRQAPVLFHNLRQFVSMQPLKKYIPQKETLSLMALGDKRAIATRGRLSTQGAWVWTWKDHIDRSFMHKFSDLPERTMPELTHQMIPAALREDAGIKLKSAEELMRCGGCGAKVPADVLQQVIQAIEPVRRDDVLLGIDQPDDAAVIRASNPVIAQSVDQFRAMLEDPFVFGRIAAIHALSDLFAMRAEPQSAQALVTLPYAADAVLERELSQLMAGAVQELNRHQCALIGGHSSEGQELSLGFVVNGYLPNLQQATTSRVQAGDQLVLTKPIGTGVLLSADMKAKARGVDLQDCIASMLISNATAAEILGEHAHAITDITGFGLLGHLLSLLDNRLDCEIQLDAIPLLPGALTLTEQGHQSTLLPANLRFLQQTNQQHNTTIPLHRLLCDPQTSGGLLAAVPAPQAEDCVAKLKASGLASAVVIGRVQSGAGGAVNLK